MQSQITGDRVTITTTRQHLETLRAAMLRDLLQLLETAVDSIHELSEQHADFQGTNAHDARSHVSWIVEAIETLDGLGWARETGWTGYRP